MWEVQICIAILVVYVVACFSSLNVFRRFTVKRNHRHLQNIKKVLFVIAHPDDECMFFSPSITHLCQEKKNVYILCLSTGNHYGLGKTRKTELAESCRILGLEPSNVILINHTKLPDNNDAVWNKNLVAKLILKHALCWDVDTLVTFGKWGVSGHRNHCAIHTAINCLSNKHLLPSGCRVYALRDVTLLRKYIGVLDVPLTLLCSTFVYVSSYESIRTGKKAMAAHVSQMVWFRKFYLFFSRYMIVNDFQLIFTEDKSEKKIIQRINEVINS